MSGVVFVEPVFQADGEAGLDARLIDHGPLQPVRKKVRDSVAEVFSVIRAQNLPS